MISKKFRLEEKEVKKVLHKGKPFFSHGITLNSLPNKVSLFRFAIVIGGKSVRDGVTRNKFRRLFYDRVGASFSLFETSFGIDAVFVVKKQNLLDKKDENSIKSFVQDIDFLIRKTFHSKS